MSHPTSNTLRYATTLGNKWKTLGSFDLKLHFWYADTSSEHLGQVDDDDEIAYFTVRWKTRASFVYRTKFVYQGHQVKVKVTRARKRVSMCCSRLICLRPKDNLVKNNVSVIWRSEARIFADSKCYSRGWEKENLLCTVQQVRWRYS